MPMNTAVTAPVMTTIECASDQVPDGYDPIGPAVRFGAAGVVLPREVPFTVPANASRVPSLYPLHVEMAYTGAGVTSPRVVALANTPEVESTPLADGMRRPFTPAGIVTT